MERKRETKPQIAGYRAKFNNLNYFLSSMRAEILKCPKKSCNDYEEEAAKVLISHLLTKESGEWLFGYLLEKMTWDTVKKLILSGLDEHIRMAVDIGEEIIKEKIEEIKKQFEREAEGKVFSFRWKYIVVLPIYLPYKERDGRYGKVDGEALMVFCSPHPISFKEIKDQVKSGGTFYVPPIGLDEKLAKLPDKGTLRPFKLIIRGTVYELGERKTYESWGETIEGPFVTFLEGKESVRKKSREGEVLPLDEVENLIQILTDQNQDIAIRWRAADALGETKDPRAVEPLIAVLKETFWATQAEAKGKQYHSQKEKSDEERLLSFGAWSYSIQQAEKESALRELAASSLGKIKDPRAVEPLIFALKNDKYPNVRRAAIWALGEIGDPRAVEPLISAFKDFRGEAVDDKVHALQKIGTPAIKPSIAAFKVALEEKDEISRIPLEEILKGIEKPEAVELLIEALNDEQWKVRNIAARILGRLKDTRAVEPLIDALGDKHPFVRSDARWALNNITGEDFGNDQIRWKRYWRKRSEPHRPFDSSFLLGRWVPEYEKKVSGKHVSMLEFRKGGFLLSTMTTSGKWEVKRTDQIVLSHDSQFFPGSPVVETYQIEADALRDSFGNVLMKDKDAQLIKQTIRGRIWDRYNSGTEGTKREVKFKNEGTFLSTLYISEKWKTDGGAIKVYTLEGKESPWIYEIKGEKIEVKLKDAPDMSFVSYVRASMQ